MTRKMSKRKRLHDAEKRAERLERALKAERNKPLPPDDFPKVRSLQVWLDREHFGRGNLYKIQVCLDPQFIARGLMLHSRDMPVHISREASYVAADIGRKVERLIVDAAMQDGLGKF
jgi:hypothetical protein